MWVSFIAWPVTWYASDLDRWLHVTPWWAIPAGALKQGMNELAISNIEPAGTLGMPPWFMVSEAEVMPVSGN